MLNKIKIGKDLIFSIFGVVLFIVIIVFIAYSINFLVDKVNMALGIENAGNQNLQRINFEELKKIGLME